jgi:hypothetical protein
MPQIEIIFRGRIGELTYREVVLDGTVVAAIWRTPEPGYRRYSLMTPAEQHRFREFAAAKRWAEKNLPKRRYCCN